MYMLIRGKKGMAKKVIDQRTTSFWFTHSLASLFLSSLHISSLSLSFSFSPLFSHSLILVLIIIITIIAVIVLIIIVILIVILIVFFTFLFINLLQLTKPSQHHSSIKMFYILKNF